MAKNVWAKGRKMKRKDIAIDEDTHTLLKGLALEEGVCLKDMVDIALVAYSEAKMEKLK